MRLIGALMVCCALVAGCGGDDDASNVTTTTIEQTPTAPAVPTATVVASAEQQQLIVKSANLRCRQAVNDLNTLEPFPRGMDPEKPGDQLAELGQFLERTDPDDQLERQLLQDLQAIAAKTGDASFQPLLDALDSIITHEVARNQAAIAGDLAGYETEKQAAEDAYAQLVAAAGTLGAPACGLGG